jgi:hypothetical protein
MHGAADRDAGYQSATPAVSKKAVSWKIRRPVLA